MTSFYISLILYITLLYIKSNTLTNNSFAEYYAKNIWSNGNGYDDAANNIFIYYAEKQPEYNRYKEYNWG